MTRSLVGRSLVVVGALAVAWHAGCATGASVADDTGPETATGAIGPGGTGGAGGESQVGSGGAAGGIAIDVGAGVGGSGVGGSGGDCATFELEAELRPAAMLVTLDMSASMNTGSKWQTAQLATVTAIDKDVFDSMSLGLMAFPTSFVDPPQCLCDAVFCPAFCTGDPPTISVSECTLLFSILMYDGPSCGVSGLPQVPLQLAGAFKSADGQGVRAAMYAYLSTHQPLSNGDDGSPIYAALQSGYDALQAAQGVTERIQVLITDGGFSCTSLASPARAAFEDEAGCLDWEHPDSVNALIAARRDDAERPVRTFVVGVPGSDSTGQDVGGFATPPYSMQLALSTYAVTGSPDTVPAGCDSGLSFDPEASAPANPCHIDLSSGQAFNADALADTIAAIRAEALGCVYPLPEPPVGESINLDQVNVELSVGSGAAVTIPRRSDPGDDCADEPCWDYTEDLEIELLGAACVEASTGPEASVKVVAGCATIPK